MNIYLKIFSYLVVFLFIAFLGANIYLYYANQITYEKVNICQDDELIVKLISENINPFSKFKKKKKRNKDCNQLLVENKYI